MENIVQVNQLLNEVHTISESYKRVAQATGENFNIFSVLRMETKEEQTHSRFIAELLNPKGSHGQGDAFLKLFLQTLNIEDFPAEKAEVKVEYYIGPVAADYSEGGRTDILIRSGERVIMIENKIYAEDQEKQLLRYRAFNESGVLLYLTQDGKECGNLTKAEIDKSKHNCISYERDIAAWLEACQKEASHQPLLRETLVQYLNLIKKLTNQNINKQMSKDIAERILKDEESFQAFTDMNGAGKEVKAKIIKDTIEPAIKAVAGRIPDLKIDGVDLGSSNRSRFHFTSDELEKLGVRIGFIASQNRSMSQMKFGLNWKKTDKSTEILEEQKIAAAFKNAFGESPKNNKWWPCQLPMDQFGDWENWSGLKKIYFEKDDFQKDLLEKVKKLIDVAIEAGEARQSAPQAE